MLAAGCQAFDTFTQLAFSCEAERKEVIELMWKAKAFPVIMGVIKLFWETRAQDDTISTPVYQKKKNNIMIRCLAVVTMMYVVTSEPRLEASLAVRVEVT